MTKDCQKRGSHDVHLRFVPLSEAESAITTCKRCNTPLIVTAVAQVNKAAIFEDYHDWEDE